MKSPADTKDIPSSLLRLLDTNSTAVLVTLIAALTTNIGAKLVIDANGSAFGDLGDPDLDAAVARHANIFRASKEETRVFHGREFAPELKPFADAQFLFELIQSEQRLVICGAGHVGAALARLAALLGYRVMLIDDRKDFLGRASFPDENIELVLAKSWTEAVAQAVGNGRAVSVAIVTRGHSEDEQCLRAVLTTCEPDYTGLIGSRRRTRIVLERLREAGISAEQLAKVHAPIGLDIGAVTPEEVALAILAEIVASRRGGLGGFLSVTNIRAR